MQSGNKFLRSLWLALATQSGKRLPSKNLCVEPMVIAALTSRENSTLRFIA